MAIDEFSKIKMETTWEIDPEVTAVLVIDMLNDFLVEARTLPGLPIRIVDGINS